MKHWKLFDIHQERKSSLFAQQLILKILPKLRENVILHLQSIYDSQHSQPR